MDRTIFPKKKKSREKKKGKESNNSAEVGETKLL